MPSKDGNLVVRSNTSILNIVSSCKWDYNLLPVLLSCIFSALFVSIFGEIFYEEMMGRTVGLLTGVVGLGSLARIFFAFVCICIFWWLTITRNWKVFSWIFKYRFILAFVVVAIGVLLELSGSSIGIWSNYIGGQDLGTIFGIDRAIRSDEWKVLTPFFLSQQLNDYNVISDIIRGGDTVTSIVYALPSWSLATIFHPFLVGFLFLGSAKGLSFFWIARFVVLFMVSFECARLFTKDDRYLSSAFAILISFAPIVQWWFAVNGIAEILIFGQLLVIFLDKFLRTKLIIAKWVYAFLIAWFAGCYLLVFYPALQIPCFYVFALMGVWIGVSYVRDKKKNNILISSNYTRRFQVIRIIHRESGSIASSVVPLIISFCLAAVCIVIVFIEGWDAVVATLNSAYPGHRTSTGGGFGVGLFYQASALLLPIAGDSALPNVCEHSSFYSFFPLGSLLSLLSIIRKRDKLSIGLFALQCLLVVYVVSGFPDLLASLTLFRFSTSGRAIFAIGLVESILLFRGLALNKDVLNSFYQKKSIVTLAIALALGFCIVLFGVAFDTGFTFGVMGILLSFLGIFSAILGILCWIYSKQNTQKVLILSLVCTVLFSGMCVNPIHKGLDYIENNQVSNEFEQVVEADKDALWISCDSVYSQLLVIAGAKTLNSVSVYPNIDLWSRIDASCQFKEVYNRYAHINVTIIPQNEKSYFKMDQAVDSFAAYISVEDLKLLGADYIFSNQKLDKMSTDAVQFQVVKSTTAGTIYKVNYC